jgi:hypothetical protein
MCAQLPCKMCTLNIQDVHYLPLPGDLLETFANLTLLHRFICTAASCNFCTWLHDAYIIAHCILSKVSVTDKWRIEEDSEGDGSVWATIRTFELMVRAIWVRQPVSQLGFKPNTSENMSLELSLFRYEATTLLTFTGTCPVIILAGASTLLTDEFVVLLPEYKQMCIWLIQ